MSDTTEAVEAEDVAVEDEPETVSFSGVSDEDLNATEAELISEYQELRGEGPIADLDDDTKAELAEIVEATKQVRAELAARDEQAEMDEFMAPADEELAADDDEDVEDAEEFEDEDSEELAEDEGDEEIDEADAEAELAEEEAEEVVAEDDAAEELAEDEDHDDEEESDEDDEEADEDDSEEEMAEAADEDVIEDAEPTTNPAESTEDEALAAEEQSMTEEITPDGLESDDTSATEELSAPALVASVAPEVPGYAAGDEVEGVKGIAAALLKKHERIRKGGSAAGRVFDVVASIEAEYPEDRVLGDDAYVNLGLMTEAENPMAVVAAGGINNPLTPYYPLQTLGDVDRPVRAALKNFKADRGGIQFMPPKSLADIGIAGEYDATSTTDAIRLTSEAADSKTYVSGTPTSATEVGYKPYQVIDSDALQSVTLDAISRQLQFGNMGARTYPEQVEHWTKLSMVAWARTAETYLLDQIVAASTAVSSSAYYGATRTLLHHVSLAVAGYRSRHRISANRKLQAIFPEWAKELIRTDLAHAADQPVYNVSDAQITEWFSARGVSVSWHIDGATGANQVFGAQGAAALVNFPANVNWQLFESGSFIHLDGGSLDLGVVRDTTTNQTNDFRIFAESFEAVAHVGVESLNITSPVLASGDAAAGSAAITAY